ncbi:hypothetical protein ABENE_18905 [Asticcacaulis benevestitus DSM 16100 = ATCC BAA-896]|uniref:Uncharacterized protein n=1 Tax=Asticcacaulis benevestitus DSM 16100 = ATCC BAA-896 TaxID=1121022 RepID=V4PJ66_9CAUL|nr:hypothetical protein ABENE_18905 [Asticcacaulis benevestitus DSM 16100 = ATCC BAA-896]
MTPYEIPTHRTAKETVVAVALLPVALVLLAFLAVREYW